jgi:hypothetical protein
MHINEIADIVYRYRVTHNIEGDEEEDRDIVRKYLEDSRRREERTFSKYLMDYFKNRR